MAQYTTTIGEFVYNIQNIERATQPLSVLIQKAIPMIFNFEFPWLNSDTQSLEDFKRLFILHFWEQEIGYETFALFQFKLEELFLRRFPVWKMWYDSQEMIMAMTENNPLYNRLIKISSNRGLSDNNEGKLNNTLIQNIDQGTILKIDNTTTNSGTDKNSITYGKKNITGGNDTTDTQDINSNNPQTNFAGIDYASTMTRGQNVLNTNRTSTDSGTDKSEATYGHVITDSGSNDSKTTGTNTNTTEQSSTDDRTLKENITRSEKGFIGESLSLELERYRKSFINIYERILDECEDLFIGILSNPYMSGGAW